MATTLISIIKGLMLSENFGDVHDEINLLHDFIGVRRPEGDFGSGWTDEDWARLEEET